MVGAAESSKPAVQGPSTGLRMPPRILGEADMGESHRLSMSIGAMVGSTQRTGAVTGGSLGGETAPPY